MTKKFKILVYNNKPVDEISLGDDILEAKEPKLYELSTSLNDIIESYETVLGIMGNNENNNKDNFFGGDSINNLIDSIENLKKCKLVECKLTI